MTATTRYHIRWMTRRDLPEVLAIEAESFEFPWLEEDFIRCLQRRNCVGMVVQHPANEDHIIAFVLYSLCEKGIRILNLAVGEKWRRQGTGTQIVEKLKSKLTPQRRRWITVVVRETNMPAQFFFCGSGFRAVSVLRGRYDDTGEDGYMMRYRLAEQAE